MLAKNVNFISASTTGTRQWKFEWTNGSFNGHSFDTRNFLNSAK